jgi:ubiquinone biosynthesis protein COQ9
MSGREDERDALLLAALPHVAFDGWTDAALKSGAMDAGFDQADVIRFFPGGAGEAIAAFSGWADRQMIAGRRAVCDHALLARRRERGAR